MSLVQNPKLINRPRVQIDLGGESRTHQSFKDECDINVVMRRWAKSGQLPPTNTTPPTYGDFTNATDYLTSQVTVMDAIADFERLPSAVRKECENDPAKFLAMVQEEGDLQKLVDAGLEVDDLPQQLQLPQAQADSPEAKKEPASDTGEKPA